MKTNYEQKIKTLSFVLNNRLNKRSVLLFGETLKNLEREHKTILSTFFLKNLFTTHDKKKNTDKLSRIVKKLDLGNKHLNSYYKEFDTYGNTIKSRKRLNFLIA